MYKQSWHTPLTYLCILIIWKIVSLFVEPLLLPSPEAVIITLFGMVVSPDFWSIIAPTAKRALAGLSAALIGGVFLGLILAMISPKDMNKIATII
ncbi:MAG: hypothetical protein AB1420_08495 [Bacillota bacterium]